MPVFDITAPDGKVYEIEGADAQGALAALMKHLGSAAPVGTPAPAALSGLGDGSDVAAANEAAALRLRRGVRAASLGPGNEFPRMLNAANAGVRMAANGMTFGLADKFAGGMDALTGRAKSYDEGVKAQRAETERIRTENPAGALLAETAGGMVGGVGLVRNGITLAGRVGPSLRLRVPAYFLEGGAYGGAHGVGSTYSDKPSDYLDGAGNGAMLGSVVGGGLPIAGRGVTAVYRTGSAFLGPRVEGVGRGASTLLRGAAQADEAGLRALPNMGPEAMLVDAGPAMLGLGQGAGTGTREGRTLLVNALRERDARTGPRLAATLDETIGPAPRPSQVRAEINENIENVRPQYNGPFDDARAVQTQPIADELDTLAINLRGPAQQAVRRVREFLNIPGTRELDPHPGALFETRQAIDGLMEGEVNTKVIAQLTNARRLVDEELGRRVPGIKQVDARYAELQRQNEGLERGSQVFDTGKTAIRPADLLDELRAGALPQGEMVGPSAVPARVREGARAEIDRLVGTHANDLNTLERTLATPQDWNSQKFAHIFGEGPSARVAQALMDNRRFRESYQNIVQNSQTAQRTEAAAAMKGSEGGYARSDMTVLGAGMTIANRVMKMLSGSSMASTKDEIGQVLASQGPAAERVAKALLESAKRVNDNARDINRVVGSQRWIVGSSPSYDRSTRR